MEKLIEQFTTFPAWKKVLFVLGLPFVLIVLFLRGGSSLFGFLEKRKRQQVDDASAKIDQEIKTHQADVHQSEGRIDQMEKDKKEAIDNAKNTDSTSFYNERYKRGDK